MEAKRIDPKPEKLVQVTLTKLELLNLRLDLANISCATRSTSSNNFLRVTLMLT